MSLHANKQANPVAVATAAQRFTRNERVERRQYRLDCVAIVAGLFFCVSIGLFSTIYHAPLMRGLAFVGWAASIIAYAGLLSLPRVGKDEVFRAIKTAIASLRSCPAASGSGYL